MLQLAYIREKKDEAIARLAIKNFDAKPILDQVLELDNDRRKTQNELDSLLNEANTIAKQVGDLYKQGKKAEADDLKNKSAANTAITGNLRGKNAKFNWLDWSETSMTGTFVAYPERESVPENIKEQLIVELYSK